MKQRLKQLGKDSLVYGLGGILARGIGFFLLPLYTRIFTPADYGLIEMLGVINGFLGSLLVMGMDSAQSFYFFEQKERGISEQAKVITAILQLRILWGVPLLLLAMLMAPLLNESFFRGQLKWEHFAAAFIGTFFLQLMSQSAEVFRLLYKPTSYIGITLTQTIISTTIAVILITYVNWGILSIFVGTAVGSSLTACTGWYKIRAYVNWSKWHRDWWPKLVKFGLPLVPTGLVMWVMNSSDRWFIAYYNSPEELGLYAVGAKFAMLVALATQIFRQACWPLAMDAMHSEDGPELFRTIARLYLGGGFSLIILLTALSPWLIKVLTSPAYYSSYPIVGILAFSSVFYGFVLISGIGLWKAEKTWLITLSLAIGSVVNILINLGLIPKYGMLGASIATSVAMLITNFILLALSENFYYVGFAFKIMLLQLVIAIVTVAGILLSYSQNQLGITVIITAVSLFLIMLLTREKNELARIRD